MLLVKEEKSLHETISKPTISIVTLKSYLNLNCARVPTSSKIGPFERSKAASFSFKNHKHDSKETCIVQFTVNN